MEGPVVSAELRKRRGYLGLGSNVGQRDDNLRAAITALENAGVVVTARASVYETTPQGEVLDQPDFLNSVIEIETGMQALELLDLCKQIERDLGRESGIRHGPRPIDIDVLLLGDETLAHERLSLPHPEIATRHFVLAPLLELAPDLVLPDGSLAADSLAAVAGQPVSRRGPL